MAAEGHTFGFALEPGAGWSAYLRSLDDRRRGLNVPDDLVPAAFLVADVGGTVVGRVQIRHQLNDVLEREGGHIGYCVLPDYRRRGYATEILRQSLIITRALGVDRVLIFCDDDSRLDWRHRSMRGKAGCRIQPRPVQTPLAPLLDRLSPSALRARER
jgi:predicted acetyltransferase